MAKKQVQKPAEAKEEPAGKAQAPKLKGLKKAQVMKAAAALLSHLEKQKAAAASLLEDDEFIYLVSCLPSGPSRPYLLPLALLRRSSTSRTAFRLTSAWLQTLALTRFPQQARKDKPIRL